MRRRWERTPAKEDACEANTLEPGGRLRRTNTVARWGDSKLLSAEFTSECRDWQAWAFALPELATDAVLPGGIPLDDVHSSAPDASHVSVLSLLV